MSPSVHTTNLHSLNSWLGGSACSVELVRASLCSTLNLIGLPLQITTNLIGSSLGLARHLSGLSLSLCSHLGCGVLGLVKGLGGIGAGVLEASYIFGLLGYCLCGMS